MAVKTNAELDAYFNTGDQPSESNFQDLIDTIQPAHVVMDSATSLEISVANHGFRDLIFDNLTADVTITLPVPVVDTWFHFVFLGEGDAADNFDLKIITKNQDSEFFRGHITHLDTTADENVASVNGDGTGDDGIDLLLPAAADIWIRGKSSTVWYVWGTVTGTTAPTISTSVT